MKKTIYSFIATVILSALSVNAQNRDLTPIDLGFGKVSPTFGDCMSGPAFCSSSSTIPISFDESFAAFSKVDDKTVLLTISKKYYEENKEHFVNGLKLGEDTTIQAVLARELGYENYFTIAKGTYSMNVMDNCFEIPLIRKDPKK